MTQHLSLTDHLSDLARQNPATHSFTARILVHIELLSVPLRHTDNQGETRCWLPCQSSHLIRSSSANRL